MMIGVKKYISWILVALVFLVLGATYVYQKSKNKREYVERYLPDGSYYKGWWQNGKRVGTGFSKYTNGDTYQGAFKNDKRHGLGIYTYVNGTYYKGEWRLDARQGTGEYKLKDGTVYRGTWMNDDLKNGTYVADSLRYEGSFKLFLPSGVGIMHYPNGDMYGGNWKDGYRSGIGKLTNEIKNEFKFGYWENDSLQVPDGANFKYGEKVYGIDVSKYQSKIVWGNLALFADCNGDVYMDKVFQKKYLQPVWFVLMKSTEGSTIQDPSYLNHVKKAQNYKIIKGAYHFMSVSSPIEQQVENYIKHTVWEKGDFPPILDLEIEERIVKRVGAKKIRAMALQWLRMIEEHYQVRPLIYTYNNYRKEILSGSEFDRYDFWIARYKKLPDNSDWRIWQFTEHGQASGIETKVDINLFNGDLNKLKTFVGMN